LFDFAAVSLALQVPFSLSAAEVSQLAGHLAEPADVVRAGRRALEPLFEQLRPALLDPHWSDLSEEYFVFQLPPDDPLPTATYLHGLAAAWLAGLVRLEAEPLSADEVEEALHLRLRYGPSDLFVPAWAASV